MEMMKLMITQMIIVMMMWMLMYLMKFKKMNNIKTMSPFECGYNSMFSKLPLSIQFTLLVFIFLLFDMELSILISSNWKINNMNKNWIMMIILFFIMMSISIMYEMWKKSIKWN